MEVILVLRARLPTLVAVPWAAQGLRILGLLPPRSLLAVVMRALDARIP
jgi:hypothetical protein